MKNKRFLIASGGTGGHFYPGFALGKELTRQGAQVLFVLRKDDPACQVLAQNRLAYQEIALHTGMPRSVNPMAHVRFLKQLGASLRQTHRLIKDFRPDVTLGMGGYVSFPLIFCSHFNGVKTAVHESNTIWGLSNKICGPFCNIRLIGLPMHRTSKNTVLVSTPIRDEFNLPVNRQEVLTRLGLNPALPTALIMGGSQGAKGLNTALPAVIKALPQWQFIHLTGRRWHEDQLKAYQGLSNVKTLDYCESVFQLIKSADVIICRSGASTLAEVIASQVPAILVPYPYAAANHQYFNAKVLQDSGCGQVIVESAQLAAQLQSALATCTPQKLAQMRANYKTLAVPNPLQATRRIIQLLEDL